MIVVNSMSRLLLKCIEKIEELKNDVIHVVNDAKDSLENTIISSSVEEDNSPTTLYE